MTIPSPAEVWLRAWCARATVKSADPIECTEFAENCVADFDQEWEAPTEAQAASDPVHLSVTLPVERTEIAGTTHTTKTGIAARGHFLGREFLLIAGSEEALGLLWAKMISRPLDTAETGPVRVHRIAETAPTEAPTP